MGSFIGDASETTSSWRCSVLTERLLARASAGDEHAFGELTDPHRRKLQLHCFRIVGSAQDAEDLLQETLLAAWRGLERFQGRTSVRAWPSRIATSRCLTALRDSGRRPQEVPSMVEPPEPHPPNRADLAGALPRRPPGRRGGQLAWTGNAL
jgi:DNA-directed RNA polymerase specialized sigma24 family protein